MLASKSFIMSSMEYDFSSPDSASTLLISRREKRQSSCFIISCKGKYAHVWREKTLTEILISCPYDIAFTHKGN